MVLVAITPAPLPNEYWMVCVRLEAARLLTLMVRGLPIVLSLALVLGTVGGICALNVQVEVPIWLPPVEAV